MDYTVGAALLCFMHFTDQNWTSHFAKTHLFPQFWFIWVRQTRPTEFKLRGTQLLGSLAPRRRKIPSLFGPC